MAVSDASSMWLVECCRTGSIVSVGTPCGDTPRCRKAIRSSGFQPRRTMDDAKLAELAESIKAQGVVQPVVVRQLAKDKYEIVAGERRWRATQLAGLIEIPAVIRQLDDRTVVAMALIENIQREDLNPLEEAMGYHRLANDFGHTQEMVAAVTGKGRSHVANMMRMLELPEDAQSLLRMGLLSVGHAKAVLQARDPGGLAKEIAARGLTVRQAEEAARKSHVVRTARGRATAEKRDADLAALEIQLSEALGMQVKIDAKGRRGSVTVKYSDLDQLDSIIEKLQG